MPQRSKPETRVALKARFGALDKIGSVAILLLTIPVASAQVLKRSTAPAATPQPSATLEPAPAITNSSIRWSVTNALVEVLLRSVQTTPKLTILGSAQPMSAAGSGSSSGAVAAQQSSVPSAHHPNVPPATQLEETKLMSIPLAAVQLAHASDSKGQPVGAQLTSPTAVALPNHTIGIYRDDDAAPFSGGTDVINLGGYLKSGFQISKVLLYTAELTNLSCQSVPPGGGQFSTNGSWFVAKPGITQFNVMWQEDSCAVRSDGPNNPDWGATSIYALDIYVVGPKGEQPLNPSYVNAAPFKVK
jgi:hypothetical protein